MKPTYCDRCGRLLDNKGRCHVKCRRARERAMRLERIEAGIQVPRKKTVQPDRSMIVARLVFGTVMTTIWRHIHTMRDSLVGLSDYLDDSACVDKPTMEHRISAALTEFDCAADMLRAVENTTHLPDELAHKAAVDDTKP